MSRHIFSTLLIAGLLSTPAVISAQETNPSIVPITVAGPKLECVMSGPTESLLPGETAALQLRVTNIGDALARGIAVAHALPIQLSYVDRLTAAKFHTLGDLAPGESTILDIPVKVKSTASSGRYAYEAVVQAETGDPVETFALITVATPQVLGIEDETTVVNNQNESSGTTIELGAATSEDDVSIAVLPATGQGLSWIQLVGILLIFSGLRFWRIARIK